MKLYNCNNNNKFKVKEIDKNAHKEHGLVQGPYS